MKFNLKATPFSSWPSSCYREYPKLYMAHMPPFCISQLAFYFNHLFVVHVYVYFVYSYIVLKLHSYVEVAYSKTETPQIYGTSGRKAFLHMYQLWWLLTCQQDYHFHRYILVMHRLLTPTSTTTLSALRVRGERPEIEIEIIIILLHCLLFLAKIFQFFRCRKMSR